MDRTRLHSAISWKLGIGVLVSILLCSFSTKTQAQVAIIINESVAIEKVGIQDLIDIFSLETSKWPDGSRIVPVEIKGKSDFKQRFYKHIGRPPESVKRSRLRVILAGEGHPPVLTDSPEDIVEFVMHTEGAIGYVPLDLVPPSGVHVVATISN